MTMLPSLTNLFCDTDVQVSTAGHRYLGAPLGSESFMDLLQKYPNGRQKYINWLNWLILNLRQHMEPLLMVLLEDGFLLYEQYQT